jgi:hypothetical protein
MVSAWQADIKDDLPTDTKDVFSSSVGAVGSDGRLQFHGLVAWLRK